ncbi:Chaperone protein ClpB [Labeo rohita]|uniref:Chaperone protein ClpB n=1 Tax=Labeo rohita TaxID=84645 RepID=A0ABQ8KZ88_LABRO|nr:Chaperone protein ClpB [Labeo rohita]
MSKLSDSHFLTSLLIAGSYPAKTRAVVPPAWALLLSSTTTTNPVSHWEDLETWLSIVTDSLLPKAAESLRHQTQDQLDDNITSIMGQDPNQSYNHKELAKITGSPSHTLIATLKLSDRHSAHLQQELTRAQRRISQLELEVQDRQEGSDEEDPSAKEIVRLRETLTTTSQEMEQAKSAYTSLLTSCTSPRPSHGMDLEDLDKLARNIIKFNPNMPGGQAPQAYLKEFADPELERGLVAALETKQGRHKTPQAYYS